MFFGNADNMICNITRICVNILIFESLPVSVIDFLAKFIIMSFVVQPNMSAKDF